jgi:hypothetical protein
MVEDERKDGARELELRVGLQRDLMMHMGRAVEGGGGQVITR